jgi:hypothetical protein
MLTTATTPRLGVLTGCSWWRWASTGSSEAPPFHLAGTFDIELIILTEVQSGINSRDPWEKPNNDENNNKIL